jgi:hypothetical protein
MQKKGGNKGETTSSLPPVSVQSQGSGHSCRALLLTDSSAFLLLDRVNDTALLGTPHTRDSGGVIIVVAAT